MTQALDNLISMLIQSILELRSAYHKTNLVSAGESPQFLTSTYLSIVLSASINIYGLP